MKKSSLALLITALFGIGCANAVTIAEDTTYENQAFGSANGSELKGATGDESVTFSVTNKSVGNLVSAVSGQLTVRNLNELNVVGSLPKWQAGLYTWAQDAQTELTLTNIKTINLGTQSEQLQASHAIHTLGGKITINDVDTLNIYNTGNAIWAQQAGGLANGIVKINANTVNIATDGAAVGAAIYGDGTEPPKNMAEIGIVADTVSITSNNSSAVSMGDTYDGGNYQGKTNINIEGKNEVTLAGATYGVTVNRQAEIAEANLSISSAGNVSITGETAAIRFEAVQDDATMIGNIDASTITLTSKGVGLQATNASMKLNSSNVTIAGATSIKAAESDLSFGVADTSLSLKLTGDVEAGSSAVNLLGSENTVVLDNAKASIETLKTTEGSETTFILNTVGSEDAPVVAVNAIDGSDNIAVNYTSEVSDLLVSGKVESMQLISGVQLGNKDLDSVYVAQGLNGDELLVNADGSVQVLRVNDLISSAQDLAITNALMWRSQLTNLTDRMGTLRTTPDAAGVWARYNNGRLDGQGIQHDYNTVELGVDKRIADNVTIGFSFDYTKGDTDLSAGSSDNNTYTVGFYGSYFNESGCFLDTMLKIGRIDADYDFRTSAGKESADYMLTGAIFGIETGHRWNIQNYFIEPQVQLTYSHLRAENYTSSIGRDVKFDDMSSLIGRVGVMAGMRFAENRGSAYVKASYNHDFLGDVEGNYEFNGSVRTFDDELDDNWGEVSLGASYQVTDSVNTFVDVGTGFGGDIDQKWRVNLGARYVF